MMEETKAQQDGTTAQSSAEKPSTLKQVTERIGPYAETFSVVAFAGVLVLMLFVLPWQPWLRLYAVPLTIGLLAMAVFAFRAALLHAEWLKQEEERIEKEEATTLYQVTEARLLTLKAVGVPHDIIKVLMKSLRRVSSQPEGQRVTPVLHAPRHKKEFLEWLIHELGLSEVRVREYEQKILTYTVYDPKAGERAKEVHPAQTFSTSQTPANGGAMLQTQ
jgi:hypothetical protein